MGQHREKIIFATGCLCVMLLSTIMFTIVVSTPASAAKMVCKGKEECAKLQEICRNNNGKMEMWTNNISPGLWGECNTFTVGGPDTPVSDVLGSADLIGGGNDTGTIPLDTLLNITATANNTAISNVDNATTAVAPILPTPAQPPAADSVTNPDATASSLGVQSGAEETNQDTSSNEEDNSESDVNNDNNDNSVGDDNSPSIRVNDDGGSQGPKDTNTCGRCY